MHRLRGRFSFIGCGSQRLYCVPGRLVAVGNRSDLLRHLPDRRRTGGDRPDLVLRLSAWAIRWRYGLYVLHGMRRGQCRIVHRIRFMYGLRSGHRSAFGGTIFLHRLRRRLVAKPDRPNGLYHLFHRAIRWLGRLHLLLCLRRGFLRIVGWLRFLYDLRRWYGSAFRRTIFLHRLRRGLLTKSDRSNGLHHLSLRAVRWLDGFHVLLCLRSGLLRIVGWLRFLLRVCRWYGSAFRRTIFLHRLRRRLLTKSDRSNGLHHLSLRAVRWHDRLHLLLCLLRGFLCLVHRLLFLYGLRCWLYSAFNRTVCLHRLRRRLVAKSDRSNGLHHLSHRAIRWLDGICLL